EVLPATARRGAMRVRLLVLSAFGPFAYRRPPVPSTSPPGPLATRHAVRAWRLPFINVMDEGEMTTSQHQITELLATLLNIENMRWKA
ncbi:hypothetical protein AB0M95_40475, partial [Sphaerisporangium sp. NPDC051017]|uniref:hypothetical protein n=1 Tax=Sphaerisporangium sp. NPDC051017 TaxID=3154636 RepID=UPI003418B652